MHTPIVWSDRRPTDKEFRESFGATKLSAQKILDFMRQRQSVIQKVVLTNSEGYWSGELLFFCLPTVLHRVSLGERHGCNAAFGIAAAIMEDLLGTACTALEQELCISGFGMHSSSLCMLWLFHRLALTADSTQSCLHSWRMIGKGSFHVALPSALWPMSCCMQSQLLQGLVSFFTLLSCTSPEGSATAMQMKVLSSTCSTSTTSTWPTLA